MSWITRAAKDYAVYWGPLDNADEFGQPRYDEPIEVRCKWEETNEQYVDLKGEIRISASIARCLSHPTVERGILWEGKLSALEHPTAPFSNVGARVINKTNRLKDRASRKVYHEAFM